MFVLNAMILVLLPFGTAIFFGALSEKLAGPTISGWLSFAGLFVGMYLVHKSFEITIVAHETSRYGS